MLPFYYLARDINSDIQIQNIRKVQTEKCNMTLRFLLSQLNF